MSTMKLVSPIKLLDVISGIKYRTEYAQKCIICILHIQILTFQGAARFQERLGHILDILIFNIIYLCHYIKSSVDCCVCLHLRVRSKDFKHCNLQNAICHFHKIKSDISIKCIKRK